MTKELLSSYPESYMQNVTMKDGKVYSVPYLMDIMVFWVNREVTGDREIRTQEDFAAFLKENLGRNTVLLLLGALLSWGAMILSPHYPDRAAFGTMILLICATLSMTGKIVDRQKENAWMFYGCAVLVWLRGMYFLVEYLGLCWGWIK